MNAEPRVLLAGPAELESRLRAALPELNGNLERWAPRDDDRHATFGAALMATAPEVVAFGPELSLEYVIGVAAELDQLYPSVEVVIIAAPSPTLWEQVARAGVRELVSPLAGDQELGAAMRRAMATAVAQRARTTGALTEGPSVGEVVVVRSAKGGSGKTMVASNIAVLLAKAHPGEVAIVDLDLQFGDVATALGFEPTYTIADAAANADLTATSLKALLVSHASRLHALCAPTHWSDAHDVTGDDVTAVLELLRSTFRYVVVDTPAGLDEATLAALAVASHVVLICSMDVSSIRALRKELDILDAPDAPKPKRHLVLNRADSKVALDSRDVEATIGAPLDLRLPSARCVPLNMNCGIPVVEAEPGAPITRQLRVLAARLAPAMVPPRARRWRR